MVEVVINTPSEPCEWCGSINDECPCAPDDEEFPTAQIVHRAGGMQWTTDSPIWDDIQDREEQA